MYIIGILGIFIAVAVLIVGSLRNKPLFPLCIIAILVVALSNGMSVWTAFSEYFVQGAHNALTSFLLLMSAATIYGEVMDKSGSTQSVVQFCLRVFGRKRAVVVILIMALIMSLAGMNGMMIALALYSITCILLKEANLPRHLSVALILFAGNFGDGFYPLSCHVNNVLPGQFLGTKLTAAAGFGLIMGVLCLAFAALYLYVELRRIKRVGEVWTYPKDADMRMYESVESATDLPPVGVAFLPMAVMTGMVVVLSNLNINSALVAVGSMLSAALLCCILNLKSMLRKKTDFMALVHSCCGKTVATMAPFIFLLGVGQVISNTEGYKNIVDWVIGCNMHPYWKAAFSTAAISGIMASAAGGIRMALTSLSDYFINSGANLDIIARIIPMASTGFDTLPHCGAIFVLFSVFDLNHKEAYRHCFWMTVVNTSICTVIAITAAIALGL